MPGTTVTRGLQWANLGITVEPEISLRLVIQSADADSAKAFGLLIERAMPAAGKQFEKIDPDGAAIISTIGALARPQVRGDQLVLEFSQAQTISLIHELVFSPAIRKAARADGGIGRGGHRADNAALKGCEKIFWRILKNLISSLY